MRSLWGLHNNTNIHHGILKLDFKCLVLSTPFSSHNMCTYLYWAHVHIFTHLYTWLGCNSSLHVTWRCSLPKQLGNITPALHYDTHPNQKIIQPPSQYTSHPRHSHHPRYNLHTREKLHPKYRAYPKHRFHPKNKVHPKHKYHPKYNSQPKQETQSNLKNHPQYNSHTKSNFHPNSTPYPHSKHKPYQEHKMDLACRPRHKTNLKYRITTSGNRT